MRPPVPPPGQVHGHVRLPKRQTHGDHHLYDELHRRGRHHRRAARRSRLIHRGSLIPQQQIRVVSVDSQDTVGGKCAATNALDGNPATMWHTEWAQRTPPCPIPWCSISAPAIRSMAFAICPGRMATPTAPLPAISSTSVPMVPPGAPPWRRARWPPTRPRKPCASRPKRAALCAWSPCPRLTANPTPVPLNSTSSALQPRPRRPRRVISSLNPLRRRL